LEKFILNYLIIHPVSLVQPGDPVGIIQVGDRKFYITVSLQLCKFTGYYPGEHPDQVDANCED